MGKFVYQNKVIAVAEESTKIKNKRVKIAKIYENDAVVMIPVMSNENILIEKQYRAVIGKWIYELPAGHVDGKEGYVKAVKRELEEETGYTTKNIEKIFGAYPAPGIITQKQIYYIAKISGKRRKQRLDEDEEIKIESFKLSELLKMIKSGKIIDNKTIAALLYYAFMVKK